MKIRTDFVTNSSSVSYIITMDLGVVEKFNKIAEESETSQKRIIFDTLKDDIKKDGIRVGIDGREVYAKQYKVRPKTQAIFDDSFKDINNVDFSAMSDSDLWKYIYGEYFINMKIDREYKGFSALLLPHEAPETGSKILLMNLSFAMQYKENKLDTFEEAKKRIFELLFNDLINNGQRLDAEGRVICSKVYSYHLTKDCKYDDSFDLPIEEVDFAAMSEEILWAYIYGEYFANKRISEEFTCFSTLSAAIDDNKCCCSNC